MSEVTIVTGFIIVLLVWWVMTRPRDPTKYIVRYFRPSCRFCAESQKEWDDFKASAFASQLPIVIVDVDTSHDNAHVRKWKAKYYFNSVPTVVKIHNGVVTKYEGARV